MQSNNHVRAFTFSCLCRANWLTLSKLKVMSTAELKNNICKKVLETDDSVILLEINAFDGFFFRYFYLQKSLRSVGYARFL